MVEHAAGLPGDLVEQFTQIYHGDYMKTFLVGNQATIEALGTAYRADLIKIDLTNFYTGYSANRGAILYVTNGQQDVKYGTDTYHSSLYGSWERGTVSSVADFTLESKAMALTLIADQTVMAPTPNTTTPIMQIIQAGLFDGAPVDVITVWMSPGWAGPFTTGQIVVALKLFSGVIASAQQVGRSKAEFEVRDWNYLLNLKIPQRVIQPGCYHTFADTGCIGTTGVGGEFGIGAYNGWQAGNTADTGSMRTVIVPQDAWSGKVLPDFSHPQPGYFIGGLLMWTTGANSGLPGHVVAEDAITGALTLAAPTLFPVTPGDQFHVILGCDKTLSTCIKRFYNAINFGGFPFVPPPEQSI